MPAARLMRLYPSKKWGFVSQVEGGFNEAKVCIVTSRAMMLPRKGKNLLFVPNRTATAFDSLANASPQQCRDLAKAKLKDAIQAITAPLLRS